MTTRSVRTDMNWKQKLNLRDLGGTGGGVVPRGRYIRSGKLSVLTAEQCAALCARYDIGCVIDLRTSVEAEEFPDPLPPGVGYVHIPLLMGSAVGITHETGSDPMTIIRNLRNSPGQLRAMIPDFRSLYADIVTDPQPRSQLDRAVGLLRHNADRGICTLFHCTAGKDRTGLVSMALLRSYGVDRAEIVADYMLTNRNAFWPTLKKCLGIALLTRDWSLTKAAYRSFMAQRSLIETALDCYQAPAAAPAE